MNDFLHRLLTWSIIMFGPFCSGFIGYYFGWRRGLYIAGAGVDPEPQISIPPTKIVWIVGLNFNYGIDVMGCTTVYKNPVEYKGDLHYKTVSDQPEMHRRDLCFDTFEEALEAAGKFRNNIRGLSK